MPQIPLNEVVPYKYTHVANSSAGTTTSVIDTIQGILGVVIINSASTGALVTLYDNTSATGTVIMGVLSIGAAVTAPLKTEYVAKATTGIAVSATGTIDLTILTR